LRVILFCRQHALGKNTVAPTRENGLESVLLAIAGSQWLRRDTITINRITNQSTATPIRKKISVCPLVQNRNRAEKVGKLLVFYIKWNNFNFKSRLIHFPSGTLKELGGG